MTSSLEYGDASDPDDEEEEDEDGDDYDPAEHPGVMFDDATEEDQTATAAVALVADGVQAPKKQRTAKAATSIKAIVANAKPAATAAGFGPRPSGIQGALGAIAASLQQPSGRSVFLDYLLYFFSLVLTPPPDYAVPLRRTALPSALTDFGARRSWTATIAAREINARPTNAAWPQKRKSKSVAIRNAWLQKNGARLLPPRRKTVAWNSRLQPKSDRLTRPPQPRRRRSSSYVKAAFSFLFLRTQH
jgi:hypothetical protein